MTRTLQEIQKEAAFELNGMPWESLSELGQLNLWPEVCRRAQLEACTFTLEKAETIAIIRGWRTDIPISDLKITSESNIVIIE